MLGVKHTYIPSDMRKQSLKLYKNINIMEPTRLSKQIVEVRLKLSEIVKWVSLIKGYLGRCWYS